MNVIDKLSGASIYFNRLSLKADSDLQRKICNRRLLHSDI